MGFRIREKMATIEIMNVGMLLREKRDECFFFVFFCQEALIFPSFFFFREFFGSHWGHETSEGNIPKC